MTRLSSQLRYFINKKITEDSNWRDVEVVLSGHEVPGEGEHKIMEYIRLSRAQPDYNPNVRHCLYGLDADLIMLGLLSHDPHFCLLREEVKFGRESKKKSGSRCAFRPFFPFLFLVDERLKVWKISIFTCYIFVSCESIWTWSLEISNPRCLLSIVSKRSSTILSFWRSLLVTTFYPTFLIFISMKTGWRGSLMCTRRFYPG